MPKWLAYGRDGTFTDPDDDPWYPLWAQEGPFNAPNATQALNYLHRRLQTEPQWVEIAIVKAEQFITFKRDELTLVTEPTVRHLPSCPEKP